MKKYNKDFEKAIETYRANPVESEDDADEEDKDGGLIDHVTLGPSHVTVIWTQIQSEATVGTKQNQLQWRKRKTPPNQNLKLRWVFGLN